MKQFCEEHDEKYQVFCKTHDCPCCRRCGLEKHKDCREIVALEDIIRNVKASVSFQDVQQQLEEIAENIAKISNDKQESTASFAQQKRQIEENISSMRQNINDHLDRIQEKLLNELTEAELESNSQIQNILAMLQKKGNEVKELQSNMVNIRKYASDLQAFLSVKQIGASAMIYENYIQSLADNKRITRTVISCKLDDAILNISSNIKRFGEIKIEAQPGTIQIGNHKHKQAQMMVPQTTAVSVAGCSLQLIKHINPGCTNIRGCCFLSDGKMVLAQFDEEKLFILNKDGSVDFKMDFRNPYDVTCVDCDTIAVSSNRTNHYIGIVCLKKRTMERKIDVVGRVCGVTHKDGVLFCCVSDKGIFRCSLNDSVFVSIVDSPLCDWSYLTIDNYNYIYYTTRNGIICCDIMGKMKWKSENLGFLLGLTVDNGGRIFVIASAQVLAVSTDGKQCKKLICDQSKPQTLHFDRASKTLLIATRKEQHFLYKIDEV